VVCFEVLFQHSPGKTEETHETAVRLANMWQRFESGTASSRV